MAERRSQRQLGDRALFLREKHQKTVGALAFAFGVTKAEMQRWLMQARRERRDVAQDEQHGVTASDG